jgi:AcrR family transcriptional regulator
MAGRRSRDDYFAAAMQILEASGFPALSASALVDHMGLTRGAFYHRFESFDDFVDGLLAYWERHYSRVLISESADVPDLFTMLRLQTQMAVSLPHGAEVAFRAWGTINARVAAAQKRVDQLRRAGLTRSLVDHGIPPAPASVYADISLNALAGAQMSGTTPERMLTMYEELGGLLTARANNLAM